VREFGLAGLGSLDFLLDGESVAVLELNARPSASLALYGAGWLRAHVEACRDGALPAALPAPPVGIGGHEIVYARHAFTLGESAAAALAAASHHHDLPAAGTRFAAGDPVCSHDARADDLPRLEARLAAQREALRTLLETP
jgi:predicted ATP-grasp superfamily ATP-dependent carboligase